MAILNLYANQYGFEIDIAGEFSPRGLGGTPFGPFPMQFPTPLGGSMIEILISDFTINSLLYAMHRFVKFIFFEIPINKFSNLTSFQSLTRSKSPLPSGLDLLW